MSSLSDIHPAGLFEDRYRAFLETIPAVRPRLHRYCARMTGSVIDGEDIAQEVLFEAYRKLNQYDEERALAPWLFGIAHHRCIDFLRKRGVRETAENEAVVPEIVLPVIPAGRGLDHAIARMVLHLPPKERSCVLLKDVLDYSLEEVAQMVDSTTGGVKAALNRGRNKLAAMQDSPKELPVTAPEPATQELLRLYVDRFNKQDWDGVRELASADARLRVADCFAGRLDDSPYFTQYEHPILPIRMALGHVDGETVVVILHVEGDQETPYSVIRITVAQGCVVEISDYIKCPWILKSAQSISVDMPS